MKWLQNFMRGRYGVDQLSNALLILYLIVAIVSAVIKSSILAILGLLILIYCWFRIFSRKTYKRSAENTRYLQMIYPLRTRVQKWKNRRKNKKIYRYFRCPNCKQELRVPKGKGAITITCPKCRAKFDKKT